jgi:hypothetical protein
MDSMADNEDTITENLVFNDGQALGAIKDLTDAVVGLTGQISNLLNALGKVQSTGDGAAEGVNNLKESEGEAEGATDAFTGAMQRAGVALQMAFGLGVYQIVNGVVNIIKGGVQDGLDFAQAMFLISTAVDQMRAAGVDVQFQDLSNIVTDLGPKLKVFSNLDLAKVTGEVAAIAGQFGATRDQVEGLVEFASIAQMRLGTDAVTNANLVSAALINITSARSTQILKAMGVEISAQDIYNEAVKEGIANNAKNYQGLDETTRQYAGINLILQQRVNWEKWITDYQKTSIGQVKDIGAEWHNLWTEWGIDITNVMPQLTKVFDMLLYIISFWSGFIQAIRDLMGGNLSELMTGNFIQDVANRMGEAYKFYTNPSPTQVTGAPTSPSGTPLGTPPGPVGLTPQDQTKIEADAEKEIISLHDSEAAALEKIQVDLDNKLIDIQTKYTRDMAALDVEQANQAIKIRSDAAETLLVDAEKKRLSDIEAQQKYYEELQVLQDQFQLSLEEALRSRDAKTIIHLIEQNALNKQEKYRQYQDENVIRNENYQQEIELAKQKEAYDLQQLQVQMDERRAALAVQRDNEIADANLQAKRQNDAEVVDINNRLKAWADGLQLQYTITDTEMKNIYNNIKSYLGAGGYVDSIYTYIIARMAQVYAALGAGYSGIGGGSSNPKSTAFASGGSLFANTPTQVTFGEAGPELAMFMPLGSRFGGAPSMSFAGGNTGGNIQLQVTLDENLQAQIVQTSLNNVALAIDRINRQA